MKSDVSIIIINYNTFELTSNCINSVIDKTERVSYEIIVVDNASTECDASIFKEQCPTINLIKSSTNLGFAGGNNLGIQHANSDYILLLNSDAELVNNAVVEAYNVINEDITIGVLSGCLLNPNDTIQAQAGRFPSLQRELRELLRINKLLSMRARADYYMGSQCDYTHPIEADWVWGAFFMFRKSDLAYFPNNLLHNTFFLYGEDLQWCYHFKKVLGKRILYHPAPQIIHYIGGSDKDIETGFDRYCKKMLPNEYKWMSMVKGIAYTRLYYFIKGLHYLTIRNEDSREKARVYLRLAVRV
jgi:GT2 family glycosyltransferase